MFHQTQPVEGTETQTPGTQYEELYSITVELKLNTFITMHWQQLNIKLSAVTLYRI